MAEFLCCLVVEFSIRLLLIATMEVSDGGRESLGGDNIGCYDGRHGGGVLKQVERP